MVYINRNKITRLVNTVRYSYDTNDSDRALKELESLLKENDPKAYLELGKLALEEVITHKYYDNVIEYGLFLIRIAHKLRNNKALNVLGTHYLHNKDYKLAVNNFKSAVENDNNIEAMTNLGICYLDGLGVEENHPKAVSFFKRAAGLGNSRAMYFLGECYYRGYGLEVDYNKEIEWFIRAAEAGSIDACLRIGRLYNWGAGVEKSKSKSEKWYLKAIEYYLNEVYLGNISSIYKIAEIYSEKLDEIEKAIDWYKEVANLGHEDAMYSIGHLYDTDYLGDLDKATYWYKKALDSGFADAGINLYFIYLFEKNEEQNAINWLRKAAELGSTEAYLTLASHYKDGKNFKKSAEWYAKLAAIEGFEAKGLIELANLYEEIEDYQEAINYYEKLTNIEGHKARGWLAIGKIYEKTHNYNLAVEYYEDLVSMNVSDGMIALGDMYVFGKGVKKDINRAVELYQQAVQSGDYTASERLEKLKILEIIHANPGIKQTDLYKSFRQDEQDRIRNTLYYMDKNDKIIRKKLGNTYQLYEI